MTCIGKDLRCPCQDGDACHYKDCGDTKALPVPQAEPVSCRFCHDKKGCWAWQCYKCGEIDDVQQPAAQPVQEPVKLHEAVISAWSLREVYFDEDGEPSMHRSPPQREWVELTEDEIKGTWAQLWYDLSHGKLSAPDAEVQNNVVMFGQALEAKLKEKNNG